MVCCCCCRCPRRGCHLSGVATQHYHHHTHEAPPSSWQQQSSATGNAKRSGHVSGRVTPRGGADTTSPPSPAGGTPGGTPGGTISFEGELELFPIAKDEEEDQSWPRRRPARQPQPYAWGQCDSGDEWAGEWVSGGAAAAAASRGEVPSQQQSQQYHKPLYFSHLRNIPQYSAYAASPPPPLMHPNARYDFGQPIPQRPIYPQRLGLGADAPFARHAGGPSWAPEHRDFLPSYRGGGRGGGPFFRGEDPEMRRGGGGQLYGGGRGPPMLDAQPFWTRDWEGTARLIEDPFQYTLTAFFGKQQQPQLTPYW